MARSGERVPTSPDDIARALGLPIVGQADSATAQLTRTPSGLYVPKVERNRRKDRPLHLDLFAGIGGFSFAMKGMQVHTIAAVEW